MIVSYPTSIEETNAIKAVLRALKIKFEIKKEEDLNVSSKEDTFNNIKEGLKEVRLFKEGKLKTTSAKDFLNEL